MNIIILLFVCFFSVCSYAQQKTFYLRVASEYNDNIYLRSKNKESDLITYISPGIRYEKLFEKSYISLSYSPTWTIYNSHPERSTLRQDIVINTYRYLTRYLRISISDHYLKSEAPIEKIEKKISQVVRRERNVYERNKLDANVEWHYNKYSLLKIGYLYEFLDNSSPGYEDSTESCVYVNYTYWPTIRYGIDLDFKYRENRTSREIGETTIPDLNTYDLRISYGYRFNKRTNITIEYYISKKDFLKKDVKDRYIREYSIKMAHKKSPLTSMYFKVSKFKVYGIGLDRDFTSYELNLTKKTRKKSTVTFYIKKGWDVGYLEARRRGFTRYTEMNISFVKPLNRTIQFRHSFSSRKNHYYYYISAMDKTYNFNTSLTKTINPNLSVILSYNYGKRTSSVSYYNYTYNSIMFSFQYIFQWR